MKKIYDILWDVMHNHGIKTEYESSIELFVYGALLTVVILPVYVIYSLIKYGDIHEGVFFLLIWTLYLLGMFLHGWCYLQRLDKAIDKGTHLQGTIIGITRRAGVGTEVEKYYRFRVQLNNGKIVKTPAYTFNSDIYSKCDVYRYKRKYYFVLFQKQNAP